MQDAIAVCHALAQDEIWIELHPETQTLILGPTERVHAHPELLHQVREQKHADSGGACKRRWRMRRWAPPESWPL